jgi:ATP-binding cassette subfamily B protein
MRVIRQVDATDCGPACLAMALDYWGRAESLHRLRELSGTTQAGTTLFGLQHAAKKLGLEAKGLAANLEVISQISLPAILHWEHRHYVVLKELRPNRALILDPAQGQRWISLGELKTKWTGNVLWLKPSSDFKPGRFTGARGFGGLIRHLSHFQGAKGVLLELALGTIVLSLLSLGAPILSQILFDRVLSFGERELLYPILAAIFVLSAFQTLFGVMRSMLSSQLATGLNYRLRLGYMDHLLHLPMRVHETRLTGDLLTRFSDLSRVRSVLSNLVVRLPATLLSLVLSLGLLIVYNPKLALIALITVPFEVLYLFWFSPRLRLNTQAIRRKDGEVQSALLGNLEGLWALRAFAAETWGLEKVRHHIAGLMDLSWRGVLLSNSNRLTFGLLGDLGSLLVLWFGATQVLTMQLTLGQLVAAYALMRSATGYISGLTDTFVSVQEGIVASDRLNEMLELSPEPPGAGQAWLAPLFRSIKAEDLSFSYIPGHPILQQISFELPRGSYTVLLGANGSGKSTLAALLTRMFEPETGRVLWDGVSLKSVSLDSLRSHVVYLKQEVPLFYASVRENLLLGRRVSEDELEDAVEAVGFDKVVGRMPEGLETMIGGESPYRLSTGERQMLGLARALLSDADLLILDEPTATLDKEREQRVVEYLAALRGKRTTLIITHREALLPPADQVLKLVGGKVRILSGEAQPLRLLNS